MSLKEKRRIKEAGIISICLLGLILFLPQLATGQTAGEAGDAAWGEYMQRVIAEGKDPNDPTIRAAAHDYAAGAYMRTAQQGAATSPLDGAIDQMKTAALDAGYVYKDGKYVGFDASRITDPAMRPDNINQTMKIFEQRVGSMWGAGYKDGLIDLVNASAAKGVNGLIAFYNTNLYNKYFNIVLEQIGLKPVDPLKFNSYGLPAFGLKFISTKVLDNIDPQTKKKIGEYPIGTTLYSNGLGNFLDQKEWDALNKPEVKPATSNPLPRGQTSGNTPKLGRELEE